ncbi:MAG TPA: prolyl oligopeptidase family serine peptidase [Firmicutes bacterium]|jgi:hypothetical protein|nr:prolyl oligopeptidase family serine peptidase [Bacillota bacterium]
MAELQLNAPVAFRNARITNPPLLVSADGRQITDAAAWEKQRALIERDWLNYLGTAPYAPLDMEAKTIRVDDLGDCTATEVYLKMEPDYFEQCYLMIPKEKPAEKLPAVVVFFYDIDTPADHNMGSSRWKANVQNRAFARHLVKRGYVTLVQRWVHEGLVAPEDRKLSMADRYAKGVERLRTLYPHWKGLGRVVWDAARCVDYLQSLDFVDPERIGCMGHSLGGKMALYAGAFDQRYKVIVCSDLGIGLSFSNYDAPWYLGPEVRDPAFGRDHHQLLGLIAPRAFLLIAGESADGDRSWAYLNSAREVYQLYGQADRIGMVNHRTGHAPTMDSLEQAYGWFDKHL